MRGPATIPYRSGVKIPDQNEATAQAQPSYPCPYKGWNARGNLANMSPLDAIVMDNVFPGVQNLSLRKGSANWSTGYPANIKILIPYSGAATNKLFASTDTNVYDATTAGAVGASVKVCTNGYWSFVNFSNSGGNWLSLVNGTDAYSTYNGTVWATPAITGIASTSLNYITAHQKRLWFIEKNSMNLWYLAVEAISGAATLFPVGSLFKKGGYLVAIGSWTIDSGSGKDDLFVMVTSNGEFAVYSGIDPNSSASWSLIGVYAAAKPLGARPLVDYGGDLLYLSRTGLQPMSKITQSSLLNESDQISYNIDQAFLDAAFAYSANVGWQMLVHQTQNMLIVNVPITGSVAYQFVMNTITKAWCRFTSWNAVTWAMSGDDAYFAGGGKVSKAWTGTSDAGTAITGNVAQAYSGLGFKGQTKVELVRPNVAFNNAITLQLALDADFRAFGGSTSISYIPAIGAAIWDTSLWDNAFWDAAPASFDPKWLTVPGELGYQHSLRMQIVSSVAIVSWTSTDFVVKKAGIL